MYLCYQEFKYTIKSISMFSLRQNTLQRKYFSLLYEITGGGGVM